ncbi:MAG TPA: mucoidy inhibitor MuiA family protein [Hyphomicrobiaceae bacterium]|nr:mucoidy inhibitor MuiA family protein [Hyphomicrobiaceae bacterium]
MAADIRASSQIDAVTVYPSGAEVVRTARVKLERGEHTLLIADLPAEAVTASIRVEGKATAGLEIGSVDTRSVSVPRDDDAAAASERRRVEEAIEQLKDDRAALDVEIRAAETQKELIANLTRLPATPPPATGAAPQPDWNQLLDLVGKRTAEAQKAILDTEVKIRAVDRKIKDLQGRLASLAPTREARTEVKVALDAKAALDADMTIRYQVRHASWTPLYDARLSVGDKAEAPKLQLVRRASIQQRTGEAWDNIALALSTARPTAGTAAPVLRPLVIDFEAERPAVSYAAPPPPAPAARLRKDRSVGATADEEQLVRFGASTKFGDATERAAKVDVQAFQAVYGIAGRTTVPDTGEVKRVQIDDMALDPTLVVRTVPKRAEKAYLYAKITTAKGAPLLPGQVALFRDQVFVGNGWLPQLGPEEAHELGFGADDSVRVRYAVADEKRSETGIISTSKTDARSYRISVKNLHQRPIEVSVLDQVPVSQHADIAVELNAKPAPSRRDVDDKRGILAWDFKLTPAEERVIDLGYRATWPASKKVQYRQGS